MCSSDLPVFETSAQPWAVPDPQHYVGIIMTSANAARLGGAALARLTHLPLYAVGDVTAEAARDVGFSSIITGDGDVNRLLAHIATLGLHRLLHLAGEDYQPFNAYGIEIERRIVYASHVITPSPGFIEALSKTPVVMLHSARAASEFSNIVDSARVERGTISIAVMSENVARAAGTGWEKCVVAAHPRDGSLLSVAEMLCKHPGSDD